MFQAKSNKKQQLTDAFIRTTDGLERQHIINFIVGYACGNIGIAPNRSNRTALFGYIKQLFENAQLELITATNLYEIIVEAIYWCIQQRVPERDVTKQFENIIHACVNEIAINRKFLRQKWLQQISPMRKDGGNIFSQGNRMFDQQSMELIKRLQQEQKQEEQKRQRMRQQIQLEEEQKLKQLLEQEQKNRRRERQEKDNVVIECQICLQEIPYLDMGTLQCGHIFHRKCIRDHIEALVNEKKVEIDCPMGCGGKLTTADVHQFIDGQLREKFERFTFDVYVEKNQGETSWCPTPGCTAAFSWQEQLDNYRCPACKNHYCLKCRCNYHYGQTCAEYRINNSYGEDDKKFQEFVKGAKYKQCPKCKFWVERIEGCSTMSCRCGHQFCYDCGGSDCPHGACKHLHPPPPVRRPVPVPIPARPHRKR